MFNKKTGLHASQASLKPVASTSMPEVLPLYPNAP